MDSPRHRFKPLLYDRLLRGHFANPREKSVRYLPALCLTMLLWSTGQRTTVLQDMPERNMMMV